MAVVRKRGFQSFLFVCTLPVELFLRFLGWAENSFSDWNPLSAFRRGREKSLVRAQGARSFSGCGPVDCGVRLCFRPGSRGEGDGDVRRGGSGVTACFGAGGPTGVGGEKNSGRARIGPPDKRPMGSFGDRGGGRSSIDFPGGGKGLGAARGMGLCSVGRGILRRAGGARGPTWAGGAPMGVFANASIQLGKKHLVQQTVSQARACGHGSIRGIRGGGPARGGGTFGAEI